MYQEEEADKVGDGGRIARGIQPVSEKRGKCPEKMMRDLEGE